MSNSHLALIRGLLDPAGRLQRRRVDLADCLTCRAEADQALSDARAREDAEGIAWATEYRASVERLRVDIENEIREIEAQLGVTAEGGREG